MLVLSAVMKLVGGPQVLEGFDHLGFPAAMRVPLGILELSCAVVYLIPATSVLGAILLSGYMGGAICTHWRVGDVFVIQTAIAVLIWVGLYLREPRLADLIPLRRR
jgi:hypothetical protein